MSATLMQQIENILRNPAIDYVWNDFTCKVTHIVPTLDPFDAGDDAATMCGLITSGADILPSYDWCPECWGAEFGTTAQTEGADQVV